MTYKQTDKQLCTPETTTGAKEHFAFSQESLTCNTIYNISAIFTTQFKINTMKKCCLLRPCGI